MAGNPNAWLGTHIHGGIHGGLASQPASFGRPGAAPQGRPWPPKAGRLAGQATMYAIVQGVFVLDAIVTGRFCPWPVCKKSKNTNRIINFKSKIMILGSTSPECDRSRDKISLVRSYQGQKLPGTIVPGTKSPWCNRMQEICKKKIQILIQKCVILSKK